MTANLRLGGLEDVMNLLAGLGQAPQGSALPVVPTGAEGLGEALPVVEPGAAVGVPMDDPTMLSGPAAMPQPEPGYPTDAEVDAAVGGRAPQAPEPDDEVLAMLRSLAEEKPMTLLKALQNFSLAMGSPDTLRQQEAQDFAEKQQAKALLVQYLGQMGADRRAERRDETALAKAKVDADSRERVAAEKEAADAEERLIVEAGRSGADIAGLDLRNPEGRKEALGRIARQYRKKGLDDKYQQLRLAAQEGAATGDALRAEIGEDEELKRTYGPRADSLDALARIGQREKASLETSRVAAASASDSLIALREAQAAALGARNKAEAERIVSERRRNLATLQKQRGDAFAQYNKYMAAGRQDMAAGFQASVAQLDSLINEEQTLIRQAADDAAKLAGADGSPASGSTALPFPQAWEQTYGDTLTWAVQKKLTGVPDTASAEQALLYQPNSQNTRLIYEELRRRLHAKTKLNWGALDAQIKAYLNQKWLGERSGAWEMPFSDRTLNPKFGQNPTQIQPRPADQSEAPQESYSK